MTAAPTTTIATTAGGNDQASVQSRSTITTASNSNLASVSSVREKARRRWEQRTNQRWRQQAAKSASADRQRPHEKAAQEEHERMLVEKASRKLREQARARAEQERRQRKAEEEQEEEEQQRQQTQSDATEGGDNDTEGASSTSSPSLEEEIKGQQQQRQYHHQQQQEEKQQGQNSREEEQEAAKRALDRQRQQKQRQQQRSAQARDKTHDKAPAADASVDAVETKTMESSFASSSVPSSSSSSASVPSSPVRVPVQNRDRVNTASTAPSVATSACTPSCTSSRPTPRSRPPLPDYTDGTSTSSVDASTLPPPPPPRQKPKSKSRVVAAVSSKRSTAASPFKFRQSVITAARRGGPTSHSTANKADGDGRRNDPIDLADSAVGTRGSSGMKDAHSPCSAGPSKQNQLVERKKQPVEPPSPPPPPTRPSAPQREQQYQSEQRTSSSLSVIGTDDRDRSLDIQWKISHQGNGELSFEDLRSLSIDDLRLRFGDDGSPVGSPGGSPPLDKTKHSASANRHEQQEEEESPAPATAQEAHQEKVAHEKSGTNADCANMSEELARSQVEMDAEEDIRTRTAARAAAEAARSHVDRSIHRWEMRSSCDPPGDDGKSPHRVKRRADPPAGDGGRNANACNTEGHGDDIGGVMFVKIDPKAESEHPSRPEQSKPIDENGEAADDNNGAVNSGPQNLHHIAEIRARELANTHGTVCSRSVVSELTYDDHLSVATGHISHFSMSPSELDEEAAEIEAMEEAARLNGHNLHHCILPCVKEESPSEASPDAASTPPVGPSPTGTTAVRKKTKIADATLNHLLKEAQDLTGMIDETELDVTQDDTTREEDHSQITDPAILAQTEEIQASIEYTTIQLQDAQRDIGQQRQVEKMLLGEVHELLRAFGISDPLVSQKIEDKAQNALHSEEEARIALARSERECKWTQEDSYKKAETESKLRSEVKGLRKKLAKVESKAKREESLLSEQVKWHHQEERMLQDEHKRLKEKLKEVTAQSRHADKKSGATEASLTDDKDASTARGPTNSSVRTESATSSSQPFDELVGLSTELSMIIDEQVGMAMAMNESSISAMSEKEAKATLHEIETMAQEIEAVMQFEQTIEQLEHTQGKVISPIAARQAPQPPTLPRAFPPPNNEFTPAGTSEAIDRHHLADAQIVQMSSPLKEEEMELSSKEAGAESEEALSERSEEGEGTGIRKDTWNATSCYGEMNAELTETDAGLTLTKPKESDATKDTSFTMSDAVTDMNLKQYFVPGTPKRLAKKAWRASPKRAAAFGQSPKRGLGLTCSVIEINGDQDTVSSIGSREVVRIAPDTPQRYSSIAKKCHETCGILDSINNFWGTQGIPEGDEEESTNN